MPADRVQHRAVKPEPWASAITLADDTTVYLRGQPVHELLASTSFGATLLLLWRGAPPSADDGRLMDACLVAAADHGPVAPSALAARIASSTRQAVIPSLASGLLAMTDFHGAGVGACMHLLRRAPQGGDLDAWAGQEVDAVRADGRRIPGVGHRTHTRDIRSERLLSLLPGPSGEGSAAAVRALARAVERHAGRPIPVNIDGAMAAVLHHLGLEPEYGDLLFAIARSGGLAAHIVEERTRQRPMRMVDPTAVTYDGPPPPSPTETPTPDAASGGE